MNTQQDSAEQASHSSIPPTPPNPNEPAKWAEAQREQLEGQSAEQVGERALEFVGQFQSQLNRLKAMAEDQARRVAELDERESKIRAMARDLESRQQGTPGVTAMQSTLDQREETLRVLAERLLRSEETAVSLSTELVRAREKLAVAEAEAALGGEGAGLQLGHEAQEGSGFILLRRARLSNYKTLLNRQAKKLLQAKAALQKKNSECEAVLAQRAKLAAASMELASQKKAVAQRMAKSQAAGLTFAIIGTLGIVLGLAWAVAAKVNPPYFAARAVLAAETRGAEVPKEELNAWTAAHERVLEDPELISLAAERFGARGMPELGNPTAVAVKFLPGKNFTIMTDKAGALTLELRGQGAEETTRELETFALAAVALANARRDVRGDGLPTIMSEAAKAGTEPISDNRLMTVLTLSAPGLAIAGVLFYGLYRVLQASKRNFERHMAVVEATA